MNSNRINIYLLLILIPYIVSDTEICSFYNNCSCSLCGEEGNYTNCDFINLFCDEGENYWSRECLTYKENYINYFANETNAKIFCGNQTPSINYSNTENIIVKTGNNYPIGSKAHCFYKFDFEPYYSNLKPRLIFELINGKNKLDFNMIIVYIEKSYMYTYAYIDLYTDKDLRNGSNIINISQYDSVEFYFDFKENKFSKIDETLRITLKLDKKPKKKDSSSIGAILGEALGTIGGIILLIIGIVICYKCGFSIDKCCKTKTYIVQDTYCLIY